LYVGFTGNLVTRIFKHKHEEVDGFTKRCNVHQLVYYETIGNPMAGIQREKQLKKWNRAWKIHLIEKYNPEWKDLFENGEILSPPSE